MCHRPLSCLLALLQWYLETLFCLIFIFFNIFWNQISTTLRTISPCDSQSSCLHFLSKYCTHVTVKQAFRGSLLFHHEQHIHKRRMKQSHVLVLLPAILHIFSQASTTIICPFPWDAAAGSPMVLVPLLTVYPDPFFPAPIPFITLFLETGKTGRCTRD